VVLRKCDFCVRVDICVHLVRRDWLHITISKMLASQLENAEDKQLSGQVAKADISTEQEIECPRCHDVMTLHSEFNRLGYLCEECDFSLI
jgi:hypothetical protein